MPTTKKGASIRKHYEELAAQGIYVISHCPDCRKGQDTYTYAGSRCLACQRANSKPTKRS